MYQSNKLSVSNRYVTIRSYTEKRRAELEKVYDRIKAYTEENKYMRFDNIPHGVKVGFWKSKADILWDHDLDITFFESPDFELELLIETELLFCEQANESLQLADEYFSTSRNFQATGFVGGIGKKMIWTNQMGSYRYKSFILAGFDPCKADSIFDMRADEIAAAFVSKMCYEYSESKK